MGRKKGGLWLEFGCEEVLIEHLNDDRELDFEELQDEDRLDGDSLNDFEGVDVCIRNRRCEDRGGLRVWICCRDRLHS